MGAHLRQLRGRKKATHASVESAALLSDLFVAWLTQVMLLPLLVVVTPFRLGVSKLSESRSRAVDSWLAGRQLPKDNLYSLQSTMQRL
jgi:hypothetical protein